MNHKHIIRRVAITIAAFLTATLAVALGVGPAMAASSPGSVNATASVSSTITLTLDQASFDFGAGHSGDLLGDPHTPQLSATVATDDPAGYVLSAEAPDMTGGQGGATIPASNLTDNTCTGTCASAFSTVAMQDPEAFATLVTMHVATPGDVWKQAWTLAVPNPQAPGSYSTTISYLATAN